MMSRLLIPSVCVLVFAGASAVQADQQRIKREMIDGLNAYAVYKVGRFEEAYSRWMSLAERGNMQGMLNVAHMLMAGEGVARDPRAAVVWYDRAARQGDPRATFELAQAYARGVGVAADPVRAENLYRTAAELGSPAGQREWGLRLVQKGDQKQGVTWVRRAAKNDDDAAQRYLVQHGLTSQKDDRAARSEPYHAELDAMLTSMDAAANARDGMLLTLPIAADATIIVHPLGGQATRMTRDDYRQFWDATFKAADRYRFVRTDVAARTGQAQSLMVDSVAREFLTSGDTTRILRLKEKMTLQRPSGVKDGPYKITALEVWIDPVAP